jgi:hypothetical protein
VASETKRAHSQVGEERRRLALDSCLWACMKLLLDLTRTEARTLADSHLD